MSFAPLFFSRSSACSHSHRNRSFSPKLTTASSTHRTAQTYSLSCRAFSSQPSESSAALRTRLQNLRDVKASSIVPTNCTRAYSSTRLKLRAYIAKSTATSSSFSSNPSFVVLVFVASRRLRPPRHFHRFRHPRLSLLPRTRSKTSTRLSWRCNLAPLRALSSLPKNAFLNPFSPS